LRDTSSGPELFIEEDETRVFKCSRGISQGSNGAKVTKRTLEPGLTNP